MKEENRIIELLAEMLKKADRHEEILEAHGKLFEKLVGQQANTNVAIGELKLSNMRIVEVLEKYEKLLEKLVDGQVKLEDGQNKTNFTLDELRDSDIRIAKALEKFGNYEERIQKLEQYIIRKAS